MISQKEYKKRRDTLLKKLSFDSIAIIQSAKPKVRSNDTEYPYRQDSNFYYLTGLEEDNSFLFLIKKKKTTQSLLFVQKKDPELELWTGERLGLKKAKKLFDVDRVYASDDFEQVLQKNACKANVLYFDFGRFDDVSKSVKKVFKSIKNHKDLRQEIGLMRLIKSNAEIGLIKEAIKITKKAHHHCMKLQKNKMMEYQLQSLIENEFKSNGAYSDAYTSIVAGGDNANTLHYIKNDKVLRSGDLILIDAGCEYKYYASDITRTIPVDGKYSLAQKDLYNMVLAVQKKIIQMIQPGVLRSDLQKKAEKLLCKGMIELGILQGDLKQLLKKKKHKRYFPHGIGHWMGIDVHDESPYNINNKEIKLQKGMILTIEPGIYCKKDDKSIPKKYRGIGIRIEDDILVSEKGCENLSSAIVKEIADVEAMLHFTQ